MKPHTLRIYLSSLLRSQYIKLMKKINYDEQVLDFLFIFNGIKTDTAKLVTQGPPYQC